MTHPLDEFYTPHDADAHDGEAALLGGASEIAYLGRAFTRDEFRAYVEGLSFPNPPAWLTVHHTSIPAASWAPTGRPDRYWDAGEAGLSEAQKVAKRLRQLRGIFDYYQNTLGWSAGPQLWADDLRIYVGTPLTQEGIHCGGGNYATVNGRRRYSLGLEVIGHYDNEFWPAAVAANAAWAVAVVQRKLQTFRLVSGKGPGFISEHRMYSKPQCPGDGVTAARYMPLIHQAAAELEPPALGFTADSAIIGPRSLPDADVIAAFARICRRHGSPYAFEPAQPITGAIGPAYARVCNLVGVRLILALAQCAHETGWLTAALAQRRDKDGRHLRNPAGIGISENKDRATKHERPGSVYDDDVRGYRLVALTGGRSGFPTWEDDAIPAHIGRLVAYAVRPAERTPTQQTLVDQALGWRELPPRCHGSAPRLLDLGSGPNPVPTCGWAGAGEQGGLDYGLKVAAKANTILAEALRGGAS